MRWQVLVSLPGHIDSSGAAHIGEELRSALSHGPAVLIADMTATVSCDHAGADALARAYQQAAVNGSQLRLVVPSQAVRTVLALTGLGHLVAMYPSLEAAVTDGAPGTAAPTAAQQASSHHDLLDSITRDLFQAGLSLQAIDPPQEADRQRLAHALQRLDDIIHKIRGHVFTTGSHKTASPPAGDGGSGRCEQTHDRSPPGHSMPDE